ncbi:HD superfamily phosphodiesterase [Massilia sp. MP_M2]|uniref:hypothetical protein n=1 Tax=Massilia sp. MP_M2 TaxID=3071713 RepID=UPI00319EA4BD
MMPTSVEKIQSAWNTFTGEHITNTEAALLGQEVGDYSELLAKILLETDFLEKYPRVKKVLQSKAPRVLRCLTDEPRAALKKTIKMQHQEIQIQLFEKQKLYTEQSKALVSLEEEIIGLRKILRG